MQEVRQDIMQLESNADTQKKHFDQRLEAVNEVAKSAEEKADGTQNQINSVRQQTEYLHNSLVAAQKHTDKLTCGLSNVMERFNRMSLVSQPPAEDENLPTPTDATSQSQSDTSPTKFYADYLHADQGQALGNLESELERQNYRSSSDRTRSSGSRGRRQSLELRSFPHWPNVAGQWEQNSSETKQKSGEEDAGRQTAEQPVAGKHAAEMRTAGEQMAEESVKTDEVSCQPAREGLEVMEKKSDVEEKSGGEEAVRHGVEEQAAKVQDAEEPLKAVMTLTVRCMRMTHTNDRSEVTEA